MAQNFQVNKILQLPLNRLDKKLTDFNFTEAQFVLDVMAMYSRFHPAYEF